MLVTAYLPRHLMLLLLVFGFGSYSWAQENALQAEAEADPVVDAEEAPYARLIRIPLPIEGTVDTRVKRVLQQVLDGAPESNTRPIVVLEFWPPENGSGDSSEFGRSLDLARYLASSKTSGARIVGYVPRTIRGHAVLVALACEELIVHPDAKIGAAGIQEASIDPTVRQGYEEIASRRRTIPAPVALAEGRVLEPRGVGLQVLEVK